jgi:hypothetical protein
MFTKWTKGALTAIAVSGLLTGCGVGEEAAINDEPAATQNTTSSTGMALRMDILAETDVAGMAYSIERVSCDGEEFEAWSAEAQVDLEDLLLPGGLETFEDQPLDSDSEHLFADYFTVLPAGCYDVEVTPIDENGAASDDCASASAEAVQVEDGETTEILLVSQCEGPERGALDTVAVINHPPTLDAFTYEPSKFTTCGEEVQVCATATDPDGDPIEFDWDFPEAINATPGPLSSDGNTSTQCATLIADSGDTYFIDVTVYDQFVEDGALVRAEDWLQERGEDVESRDSLEVPLHVQCEEQICPEGAAAIESYSFNIITADGNFEVGDMEGNLMMAQAIEVEFTVAPGCEDIPVAIGSYADAIVDDDIDPMLRRFDVDAGIYSAGTYTQRVSAQPCSYRAAFGLVEDFDFDGTDLPGVDEINILSTGRAGVGFCE